MNETTDNLIARLEGATGGSPSLSEDVLKTLGWQWECVGCPGGGMWKDSQQAYHCGPIPLVTERVEDARSLIPENVFVAIHELSQGCWGVQFYMHMLTDDNDYKDPIVTARACTISLALCSAVVKLSLYRPDAT